MYQPTEKEKTLSRKLLALPTQAEGLAIIGAREMFFRGAA